MDKPRKVAIYMRVARAPRAWIYCRTAEPNAFALRMQQEQLSAFAEKNHYDIVGCTSKQETGTIMARPGLAEITNATLRGEMDILLVLNASRLGRDIRNLYLRQGRYPEGLSGWNLPPQPVHHPC